MNPSRNLAARRRVRPGVEALEDRRLLTVFASPMGTTLNVTGLPNQAHTIKVFDDGHGDFTVIGDGKALGTFTGIKTLNIHGGKLKNTVQYFMTGPLMQTENVTVWLGGAKNKISTFSGLLEKDFIGDTPVALIGGHLTMSVLTGPGSDLVNLAMRGNLEPHSSLNFSTSGIPGAAPVGTEGMNVDLTKVAVESGSSLSVHLNAGQRATEVLHVENVLAGAVTDLAEHGGPGGNNNLTLIAHPTSVPINATIDGGGGNNNEATYTPNVSVSNCQVKHQVP